MEYKYIRDERNINGVEGCIEGYAHHKVQGHGRVDGYPWYFSVRDCQWDMEIAQDKSISPDNMPCVALFSREGEGGWYLEGNCFDSCPDPEHVSADDIWLQIGLVVALFRQGELPYLEKRSNTPQPDEL